MFEDLRVRDPALPVEEEPAVIADEHLVVAFQLEGLSD